MPSNPAPPLDEAQQALLDRYVRAFEDYDMNALTSLLREDAEWSMPPYDLWLQTHDDIVKWCVGPGNGCRDSKLIPTRANGMPAFGQYKPDPNGGRAPWSLQVVELDGTPDQGDHVLSRHGAVLPAVRAARPRRLAGISPASRSHAPARPGSPGSGR